MIRLLLVAVVTTFATAVPALSQEAAPPPMAGPPVEAASDARAKLMATDTDHDGKFSKAEWVAAGHKERGFDMMDANHDGFVTTDEVKAGRAKIKAMRESKGK